MVEEMLREIALSVDAEAKRRMIQEIVGHADENIKGLVAVLQRQDDPLASIALEVIQTLGYPQGAPALLPLVQLVGTSGAPLQEQAFRTLITMGPSILPELMHITQDWDDPLYDALSEAGLIVWKHPDYRPHLDKILANLPEAIASIGEAAIPALIFVLTTALKEWWGVALQTLETIGFPTNATRATIPLIIAHVCDRNNPAGGEALKLLQTWKPEVVTPYFLDILLSSVIYGKPVRNYYWGAHAGQVCELLLRLDKAYTIPCIPALSYLLQKLLPEQAYRAGMVLDVFEKVGPEHLTPALPSLIELRAKEGASQVGQQAQRLIDAYGQQILDSYHIVFAVFDLLDDARARAGQVRTREIERSDPRQVGPFDIRLITKPKDDQAGSPER